MEYKLSPAGTGMGVGWFSCVPEAPLNFYDALAYLKAHPNDQFMQKHLLESAGQMDPENMHSLIQQGREGDPRLLALTYESCIQNSKFNDLLKGFRSINLEDLLDQSPLIYLRWALEGKGDQNLFWLQQFSKNTNLLVPLPDPETVERPLPYDQKSIQEKLRGVFRAKDLPRPEKTEKTKKPLPAQKEKIKNLTRKLERLGILTGWETRSEATLSPYAVERPWNLNLSVSVGRNQYRLKGSPTSYGRGLNIHQARLSCLMEAAERYSAFGSFENGGAIGYKKSHALFKAGYKDLLAQGNDVLDPNDLCLEVAYKNQPLYWIKAERRNEKGLSSIYVPAQLVFLFANFDEISLTSGLPSNGFAAGFTPEEAKLRSILEVLERDGERVMPYSKNRCFLLESGNPKIEDILKGFREKGIQIQFLDMTSELGIPCYRAFVQGPGGVVLKGSGANLDGNRAAVAAMTEIPYPYPYWFGAAPVAEDIKTCEDKDLPNYASGDPAQDLTFLEKLLLKNGYHPIYIDLTREDLDIPVFKTLIPGLEMMTVLDLFSPLSIRQFAHYLELFNQLNKGDL